jgi:outer membrane protein OmpA-like peptidoglycan-associated protein
MFTRRILTFLIISFSIVITSGFQLFAQQQDRKQQILEEAKIEADKKEISITVSSIDISQFPKIKLIIEAYNKLGHPLDSLSNKNLFVYENGVAKKVISVEKIQIAEEVQVDFVFLVDKTGSMQKNIDQIRNNIKSFANTLMKRGIDYRLGLIYFSDDLEKIYQPTKNVENFMEWLGEVRARGGGDEKENALEALEKSASNIAYRNAATKVAVLITDAPYHQQFESGHGITNQTTESIVKLLQRNEIRVFSIVPPKLTKYKLISDKTRGNFYDIDYSFSTILDNFSTQLTNLFALTYNSDQTAIPDSIEIALFNPSSKKLVKKTIPIVELGRKLIIENLLYKTASAELPDVVDELNILAEFLKAKPNIAIMIEGHTDNIGSRNLNLVLSEKRALSVKNYLVSQGIDPLRIKIKGYGEEKPIASNSTEFGRKLNRRTEIVIVAN